ncbi:MAG: GntR family transcriptional regulator [Kiritimatiellae bacterium]|nr:GntR family transcriptional regulator [Kiritimatiellia bacterium]
MDRHDLEAWLDEQIRDLPPGARVPSDRALARAFGLAKATVQKVLRPYRQQGRLVRCVGKGTFTAGASRAPDFPRAHSSAQSVEMALAELISSGALRAGAPLPAVKELCLRFGVSRPSVVKGLDRLVARRLAVRIGRNAFAGPDFETVLGGGRRGAFHFFMHGAPDFSRIYRTDFLAPAFRAMERILLTYGGVIHYQSADELPRLSGEWRRAKRVPLGLLFLQAETRRMLELSPFVTPLIGRRRGKKVSVVIDLRGGPFTAMREWGEVVSRGHINTIASRTLADFVGGHGGSRVRFFLDAAKPVWDDRGPAWPIVKLRAELHALSRPVDVRFFVIGKTGVAGFDTLIGRLDEASAIEARLSKHRPFTLDRLRREVHFARALDGLLARHRDADLWIFSSARSAERGLAFARARGIRVPADLSILCLEDDPGTYHLGIAYCGPDFERIGYLLAHGLLGDIPITRSRQGLVTAGAVLLHKQTARVPGPM